MKESRNSQHQQLTIRMLGCLIKGQATATVSIKTAARHAATLWLSDHVPGYNAPFFGASRTGAPPDSRMTDFDLLPGLLRLHANESKAITSNFQRAMSIVMPRSRSALSLSSTQAYLNEDFPMSADSFSNFSIVRESIPPHLYSKCPVVVDLPESTCPITTMEQCCLSLPPPRRRMADGPETARPGRARTRLEPGITSPPVGAAAAAASWTATASVSATRPFICSKARTAQEVSYSVVARGVRAARSKLFPHHSSMPASPDQPAHHFNQLSPAPRYLSLIHI